ncbi:MAG TPA: nuclear transport factor 2 family protein [Sphingobium sp.]|nr:nuclear transport factor 2 family protein [Sphingobium sp.]
MSIDQKALEALIAKDEIRDLVLLYSRGVDRKDATLLRTLYTRDGVDNHGDNFQGSADDYVAFLVNAFSFIRYSGHHVCNHLISVDVEKGEGEGEVYVAAWHVLPDGKNGWIEDLMLVRYLDHYAREDGRWRFARRDVTFDMRTIRPHEPHREAGDLFADLSYDLLSSPLFARGVRS